MVFYIRNNTIKIDKSPVHGKGVYANIPFKKGDVLGIAMKRHSFTGNPDKDFFRTAMGRYVNHSDHPNSRLVRIDLSLYVLQALTSLNTGQEILVDYKDFETQMYKKAKAKMVDVETLGFKIDTTFIKQYSNNSKILLNEHAAKALKMAEEDLPKGYNFVITYGFRSLQEQTKIVKDMEKELKKSHPDNWEELLKKYTGGYEELKLKTISNNNHRSGNAVDLKLSHKGKEVDLGGQKMDERDRLDYKNINKNVQDNRMLLKKVLEKHGFKNNPDEWWHWGYNDRG